MTRGSLGLAIGRESDAAAPPLPPGLVIVVAVFGVSWAAILVRWSTVAPFPLAFWRLTLSLLVIAVGLTATEGWRHFFRMRAGDLLLLGLAGVLLAFHFAAWFASLDYTTVASSTLFVDLHPLFAAAISAIWLRERPTRGEWVGIGVATAGALVIGGVGLALGPAAQKGNALALFAGLLVAGYFVIGRRQRRWLGLWAYVGWVYVIAALVLLPIVLLRGEPLFAYPAREWLIFAGLAAGPMLLGHTGFNWALRYVRAYIVNLAILAEPIGASLLAWWLIGGAEVLGPATVAGGVLILTGLAISVYSRQGASA